MYCALPARSMRRNLQAALAAVSRDSGKMLRELEWAPLTGHRSAAKQKDNNHGVGQVTQRVNGPRTRVVTIPPEGPQEARYDPRGQREEMPRLGKLPKPAPPRE